MADKSFEAILQDLQNESVELLKKNTLAWYLAQIRALAAKDQDSGKRDPDLAVLVGKPRNVKEPTFPQETVQKMAIGTTSGPGRILIGSMVIFVYDAKGKDTLPYWDKFPLVFPIGQRDNGFLGLNLHYLPPYERSQLMTSLYATINTKGLDDKSKIAVNYKILQNSSRYRLFRPCVKRYLTGHIRSRMFVINPLEWHRALLLPLANFQKAEDYKVWQDSINSLKKRHK